MKIHGHPQKTDYLDDGSDWLVWEAQGHWPLLDPIASGHVHVAVSYPLYGEITSVVPFWVPFTLKLHNIAGSIDEFGGPQVSQIVWDATGNSTPPVMRGSNPGLEQWTGKALIDVTLGQQPWLGAIGQLRLHGWSGTFFMARARVDNGDQIDAQLTVSHYDLIDPTTPEVFLSPDHGRPGVFLGAQCVVSNNTTGNSQTLGGNAFGDMIIEVNDYLPLMPITAPWPTIVNFYNYTSSTPLPNPGHFRQRLDSDLHHSVLGLLIEEVASDVNGVPDMPIVIDPATLAGSTPPLGSPPNVHKELFFWTQTNNNETVSAVLTCNVPLGSGVPVPTTCQDKAALNFGQLLPCVYATPPPPPMLMPVPNVVGMAQSAATAAIVAAGFTLGPIAQATSDTAPAGDVISQDPVAGVNVPMMTAIGVTLSTGPAVQTVTVPNVIGLTCNAATNALTAVGLVTVSAAVTDQSPAAGTSVPVGSSVTVTC